MIKLHFQISFSINAFDQNNFSMILLSYKQDMSSLIFVDIKNLQMYWSKLRDMSSSMYNYIMPIKMSRMQTLSYAETKSVTGLGRGRTG